MAYEKQTWKCGDIVSAEKLNHIEDGIEECCSDKGYECTETTTLLTEESVTTEQSGRFVRGPLSYSQLINADTIRVTFDGIEYVCSNVAEEDGGIYGAGDGWTTYPFVLDSNSTPLGTGTMLYTETAGTYSVKIEAVELSAETTPCFRKAVQSLQPIINSPLIVEYIRTEHPNSTYYKHIFNKTLAEVDAALRDGKPVYTRLLLKNGTDPIFSSASLVPIFSSDINTRRVRMFSVTNGFVEVSNLYADDVDSALYLDYETENPK